MAKFKPMLADDADLSKLRYPLLVSPKLDGVRATFVDGQLLTRSLKPLANPKVAEVITHGSPLDGELIVGDPRDQSAFRETMKVVSSHTADVHDLRFYVFDAVSEHSFSARLAAAHKVIEESGDRFVPVPHVFVDNECELLHMEDVTLAEGYEGLMLRDPQGRYKMGRSTVSEGSLLKLKRRLQSEAIVVDVVEQLHNANEAKLDNLGYTERSSHKANKIPTGVLGALVVKDVRTGVEFNVGTGFTAAERDELWKKRHVLLGMQITYEYLPVGVKERPRHPVFLGWRTVGT